MDEERRDWQCDRTKLKTEWVLLNLAPCRTDATTPNIVWSCWFCGSWMVVAVVCKRTQHCKNVQCIKGRIRPIWLCKLRKFGCLLVFNMSMRCFLHGRVRVLIKINNVGGAVQMDFTLRRSRNKRNIGSYWLKSLTIFRLHTIKTHHCI